MKVSNIKKFTLGAVMALTMMTGCSDDKVTGNGITERGIAGYAQKGQLIKGSTITAFALDEMLKPTGESFPSAIKDDMGSFSIPMKTGAALLELRAEGYYFVENRGGVSEAPIYLTALTSAGSGKANINLLTTLTNGRIRKLMAGGKGFEQAKQEAERELMQAMEMSMSNWTGNGFEHLSINGKEKGDALLLAASCLIQENRYGGEVQEMIAEMAADFEHKGYFGEELKRRWMSNRYYIDIVEVVEHLIEFYEQKGIKEFEIPPFYACLNPEYAEGLHVVSSVTSSMEDYDMGEAGGEKTIDIISYEPFATETDVDWIKTETKQLCNNIYRVTCRVEANGNAAAREGNVVMKVKNETLYEETTKQQGNGQRIYLKRRGIESRSGNKTWGKNKVNINGKEYMPEYSERRNIFYVDVPKKATGYGVSTLPKMVVPGEDVLCATITYPAVTDEVETAQESTGSRGTTIEGMNEVDHIPYYGALKPFRDMGVNNPAEVKLEVACGLVSLKFVSGNGDPIEGFSKMMVEVNEDGCMSGEVTACMYPDQELFDPSYKTPNTVYKNKSNRVTINNTNKDNMVSVMVHPQLIKQIKCTAYNEEGKVMFSISSNINFNIEKGKRHIFNITK